MCVSLDDLVINFNLFVKEERIMDQMWIPIVKGICVAAVLGIMGLGITDGKWWIGCFAMNIALNLQRGSQPPSLYGRLD